MDFSLPLSLWRACKDLELCDYELNDNQTQSVDSYYPLFPESVGECLEYLISITRRIMHKDWYLVSDLK